jgi:hypothetical protein
MLALTTAIIIIVTIGLDENIIETMFEKSLINTSSTRNKNTSEEIEGRYNCASSSLHKGTKAKTWF